MLWRLTRNANTLLLKGQTYGPGDTVELTADEARVLSRLLEPDPIDDTPDDPVRLNLNTATLEQLKGLKYIGDVKARDLMKARPFESLPAARQVVGLTDDQWAEIVDGLEVWL